MLFASFCYTVMKFKEMIYVQDWSLVQQQVLNEKSEIMQMYNQTHLGKNVSISLQILSYYTELKPKVAS